jgi:hypothetical protein
MVGTAWYAAVRDGPAALLLVLLLGACLALASWLVLPVLLVAAIYAATAEIIVQRGGRRSLACKTRTAKRSRATAAVQRSASRGQDGRSRRQQEVTCDDRPGPGCAPMRLPVPDLAAAEASTPGLTRRADGWLTPCDHRQQ